MTGHDWIRLSVLALSVSLPAVADAADRVTGKMFATRSEVVARHGMAATAQPLATDAALDILKRGGNAIDAAIAANAVLAVVEPVGCGIGGDLFALVWSADDKRLHGLNASGRSPRSLTLEEFKNRKLDKIPSFGPLPVSVPGTVDGWFELHKKFGKLPMTDILAPAIFHARNGFPVTELIAYYWERNAKFLESWPGFRDLYMPGGQAPKKGEIFRNRNLATTLEIIGEKGRDVFYKGPMARIIADYMKENGGYLSYEDMASHTSEWVTPQSTDYRGYTVWELPPNGQGIAALQMLNILERYDIASMGFGSADYLHTLIEAKKLVFEDRARFYSDMAFNQLPVKQLISKSYANERKKLINPGRAAKTYDAGINHGDTTYLTVADRQGNMVSLIQSNYRGMGSGMTPTGLGFVLQNRGELFALQEGHNNVYEPGKRPFHTIIPAFVTRKGKPYMSFGVMGGSMQPQGHVQILVNMIDFGMNLQEAGDAPRMRHDGSSQPTGEQMKDGGTVFLESGIPQETVRELLSRGHRISEGKGGFGGYQAIMFDDRNKVYFGASESRKDGAAAGY
ncbi:MAG: gamma-glutamyltransferase [Gammaproteobacteria bacterium]|nr:gamma-glutamyltransferase [Gammaproteobacteria bacterium]